MRTLFWAALCFIANVSMACLATGVVFTTAPWLIVFWVCRKTGRRLASMFLVSKQFVRRFASWLALFLRRGGSRQQPFRPARQAPPPWSPLLSAYSSPPSSPAYGDGSANDDSGDGYANSSYSSDSGDDNGNYGCLPPPPPPPPANELRSPHRVPTSSCGFSMDSEVYVEEIPSAESNHRAGSGQISMLDPKREPEREPERERRHEPRRERRRGPRSDQERKADGDSGK